MARPRGTPLIDYLHQELDGAVGAANVPLVLETVVEWMEENAMPRGAQTVQLGRVELQRKLKL